MKKQGNRIQMGWQTLTVESARRWRTRNNTLLLKVMLKTKSGRTFCQKLYFTKKGLIISIRFLATILERCTMQNFRPLAMAGKTFTGKVSKNKEDEYTVVDWRELVTKQSGSNFQGRKRI